MEMNFLHEPHMNSEFREKLDLQPASCASQYNNLSIVIAGEVDSNADQDLHPSACEISVALLSTDVATAYRGLLRLRYIL